MCGRYIPLTLRQVLHVIDALAGEAGWGPAEDWDTEPRQVFPGDASQLIIPFEDESGQRLEAQEKRWGYEVGWKKGPIFNTRIESALGQEGGMWKDSLRHRRCLVPCRAFFEPHREEQVRSPRTGKMIKRQYEFASPDGPVLLMAGIWEGERYSIVTTEANELMAPIHSRMPILVPPAQVATWLGPAYPALAQTQAAPLVAEPTDLHWARPAKAAAGEGSAGRSGADASQGRLF